MAGAEQIRRWRLDPSAFVREQFGVVPDEWQADALRAFADPKIPRISMQACAGPGKSAVMAWCGLNWLACYAEKGDHPKGAATSITGDNLKDNLWPEFAKWMARSPFLSTAFCWTKERIFARDHPETWFLSARTWPKTASAEEQGRTLSGLHSGYPIALIDESGAIPVTVLRAADQALSNCKVGKIVQAGNPLTREGMLYAASTELAEDWHVIRITGDPDDPKRSPRIDIEWARKWIDKYGRDDPWVMAYILGQFPLGSINTLLSPDEVRDAMARQIGQDEVADAPRVLGVDVAREGLDRSVIFPRQGRLALEPIVMRGVRSVEGAGRVAARWRDWDADACFIDNTGGFGAGWIDQLRVLKRNPVPVEFAGSPLDSRYSNKRTEMWFLMAEWVRSGGALPNMPELVKELSGLTYTFKGDRLALEPKDAFKRRIQVSPDLSDALACTFAFPIPPRGFETMIGLPRRTSGHDEFGFGG